MTDWLEAAEEANRALLGTAVAEAVTYTAPAGSPEELRGVFSEVFESVDPESGVPILSQRPNVWVRLADLAAAPVTQAIVVARSRSWSVSEIHPDGDGGALLLLHRDF